MTEKIVKSEKYRDVEIFVTERDGGFYSCYEGVHDGNIVESDDFGSFDTVESAFEYAKLARDNHDAE